MERQEAIRVQARRSEPLKREIAGHERSRALLVETVQRLAAEDPKRAHAFLLLLRAATKSGSHRAVSNVLTAFGGLGSTIAEAARPTPLTARPATLADSWNTVGRIIGSSMIEFGERHDRHAG